MPMLKAPNFFEKSPLFGAPTKLRTRLAMFSGQIMVRGGGGGGREKRGGG